MRQHSCTPSASRAPTSRSLSCRGPGLMRPTVRSNRPWAATASWTNRRQGSETRRGSTRATALRRGRASATRAPQQAAPTPAAASRGSPPRMAAAAPAPASTIADGDVSASAVARLLYRSGSDCTSEVGDDGGEDLVDGLGVAGVVAGGVGCFRHAAQDVLVGILAVGDGEETHGRGRHTFTVGPQGGQELVEVVVAGVVVPAVGEQHDGVDASGV